RHGVGRRRLGEDTAVAGPPARGVDADLPLELADRGADVGHALSDAGVVYDVARLERVRAVDDDVVVADELPRVLLGDADGVRDDLDPGVERLEAPLSRLQFRGAHVTVAVQYLPVQV